MDDLRDVEDAFLEDAERVRHGDHERRDVLRELRLELGEVDRPAPGGPELDDRVPGEMRGRGVRAVRGVGHEDVLARVARLHVRGADHEGARELAVRAGRRLERDAREPGEHLQRLLEPEEELEIALREVLGGVGVRVVEAGEARDLLVEPRVVLHRARAERVERRVDREVQLREAREVPHDVDFGGFHLPLDDRAVLFSVERGRIGLGHVERREEDADAPRAGGVEERAEAPPPVEAGVGAHEGLRGGEGAVIAHQKDLRVSRRASSPLRGVRSVTATRRRSRYVVAAGSSRAYGTPARIFRASARRRTSATGTPQ